MNEEVLNISLRKFLKTVGVTSQREIEKAIRTRWPTAGSRATKLSQRRWCSPSARSASTTRWRERSSLNSRRSLTDHRVVTAGEAARFLMALKLDLERAS